MSVKRKPRIYTERNITLLSEYLSGLSTITIAGYYSMSKQRVQQILQRIFEDYLKAHHQTIPKGLKKMRNAIIDDLIIEYANDKKITSQ